MDIDGYGDFELIGSGGNAHVYRATTIDTDEVVAIKVLYGGGDDAVARRFERERTLMSELDSIANVVPVHTSGVLETGDPFLVMPLFEGGSLEDQVDTGPVPWRQAVELTKTIADSIALAHAKRILHLDIKPANVLLDDTGEPWLADFGIAETMGPTVSMSAKMMTPAYTPPERVAGGKPSEQTDTYGVVATLFALLSGRQPYVTDKTTNAIAVAQAVQNDPLAIEWVGDVPESVRNLLLRGMAKDPNDRPRSAIELVGLLEDVLEGRDVAPLDSPSSIQTAETIIDPDLGTQDAEGSQVLQSSEESSGGPNPLKVLVPLGVVGLAVLVGFFVFNGGDGGDADAQTASSGAVIDQGVAEASVTNDSAVDDEPDAVAPIASFEVSATDVEPGATVNFRDTSDGDVSTVDWFISDGREASGSTLTRAFPDPGRYNVELTVTGPGGTDTASQEIRVGDDAAEAEQVDPPPRPDNIGCQFVSEEEVWWVFSALPALVDTYEIELDGGVRRDLTDQPRPFVLDDGELVRIIAVGPGGEVPATVGSCESHGGVSLALGGPAVPTNIRCEFHDHFWRDGGLTWSETWSWDPGDNTDGFLLKYNRSGVDEFVDVGSETSQTNADVNGGANQGFALKGIVSVGDDVERELPIGNCGQMGGTGWPDPLPAPPAIDVSQRVTSRNIGDTFLRFSFGPDVASGYTATVSSGGAVVTTLTGEAQAGQEIDEMVEDLQPGTDYLIAVSLTGETDIELSPVVVRTSGEQPELASERVSLSEVEVVDARQDRIQLNFYSNICANASFEIRSLDGAVVGTNAGLDSGCSTSHHAVPGFWTDALEPSTTYEIELQVEADGAGLGGDNIATETLTITTAEA